MLAGCNYYGLIIMLLFCVCVCVCACVRACVLCTFCDILCWRGGGGGVGQLRRKKDLFI